MKKEVLTSARVAHAASKEFGLSVQKSYYLINTFGKLLGEQLLQESEVYLPSLGRLTLTNRPRSNLKYVNFKIANLFRLQLKGVL